MEPHSTSSIRSIQPRNTFKYEQYLEYYPPRNTWSTSSIYRIGPRNTWMASSIQGSIGPQNTASRSKIKIIEPKHSQNAQFKHHLLILGVASKPGVPAESPSLISFYLVFYLRVCRLILVRSGSFLTRPTIHPSFILFARFHVYGCQLFEETAGTAAAVLITCGTRYV